MRKTLLISTYAPPAIGGPQNIYNLLRDADLASYTVLTSFYNIDNLSARVGNWLPGEYRFYDKPSATKAQAQAPGASRDTISGLKHAMKRSALIRTLAGPFVICSQIVAITRAGVKALSEGKHSVIMAVSDYGPALIASYRVHKKTGTPLMLFMFDLYKRNFLPFPGSFLARVYEKKIFLAAEKIIVTNEGTKEYYAKEYGPEIAKKLVVIHNSAFVPATTPPERIPHEPYTILYTGRIYWPQIGALRNLVEAVKTIDIPVHLKLYAPNPPSYLKKLGFEGPNISLSVAAPKDMPRIQADADVLFLPLSWNTKSQPIIDTATPGKFTDYLIAGRPMLIHAPATTFVARYARENNCALVVDTDSVKDLQEGIKTLIVSQSLRAELVANARKTFMANHEATANAAKLIQLLS